jgi:hypothetical protein
MGISVDWDDLDHEVIRWEFTGRWTWNEFDAALLRNRLMEEGEKKLVCAILYSPDHSSEYFLPKPGVTNMARLAKASEYRIEYAINVRITPSVGKGTIGLIASLFPWRVRRVSHAETVEQARSMAATWLEEIKGDTATLLRGE